MAAIGALLILAGLAGLIIGGLTLIHPIQRLHISTRKVAGIVAGGSFVVLVLGGVFTPTKDKDGSKPIASTADATRSATQLVEKATATSRPENTPKSTGAPKPTNTPKPTDTPKATNTAKPTDTPGATITAKPVATPQSLEQRIEKSIRDNKNAVTKGANLDNLQIAFDPPAGLLTVSIRPNSPDRDSQFITNGSAMAIISGKAIWTTYEEVQRISVQVYRETKDDHGNPLTEQMAVADYARENGLKYNYGNLKNQPSDDNKLMYCTADFYALSERVWNALGNKGCLKARAGGANPTEDEDAFLATLNPPPATPKSPTAIPAPVYKLRVSSLSCSTDSLGDRVCTGVVTNIQPDKNATDISPLIHWIGGTDSDFGSVAINPILPGQSSTFTVYTLHPNPQLTSYTIGFKKVFGSESDYPVEP